MGHGRQIQRRRAEPARPDAKAAKKKISAEITVKPVIGEWYRLRNGAKAKCIRAQTFPKAATVIKTGAKVDVVFYHGQFAGATRSGVAWNDRGEYGANYRGHELDIVSHIKRGKK